MCSLCYPTGYDDLYLDYVPRPTWYYPPGDTTEEWWDLVLEDVMRLERIHPLDNFLQEDGLQEAV
jgi:hypothetical protein